MGIVGELFYEQYNSNRFFQYYASSRFLVAMQIEATRQCRSRMVINQQADIILLIAYYCSVNIIYI